MEERYKKAIATKRRNGTDKPSKNQKKKISEGLKKAYREGRRESYFKGIIPWNKGKTHSEETRKKISNATKKQFKEKGHPFKGKKHTEESRIKMSKSRTGKSIGKERWNWKGGVSSKNRLIRTNSKWKSWRNKVFERDNYTCQNKNCKYCHNKKGIRTLHPHHKKQISKFPELCFVVSNGVTLCSNYHLRGGLHNGKE